VDGLNFKDKLGALPVWGWGVLVAGGALLIWFLFRGRGGNPPVSGVSGTSTGLDAMGYQTSGIKGGSGSAPDARPETNQQWLARVSRLVADTLAASPSEVNAALYKYVTGQDITTKEKGFVDKAIQLGMSPPEGVQGVGNVTPPTPVSYDYVKTVNDGTIYQLDPTTKTKRAIGSWDLFKALTGGAAKYRITSTNELAGYKTGDLLK